MAGSKATGGWATVRGSAHRSTEANGPAGASNGRDQAGPVRRRPILGPSALIATAAWLLISGRGTAAEWPTYRGDASRTARTEETLNDSLALAWTYTSQHVPQRAWPGSRRMQFDQAMQVVAGQDRVVFGSSADGTVTCLDAARGAVVWEYFTEGPVRFAPVLWRDRVLVGSDDGYLYALQLADGTLLWKRRGGPTHQLVLGNEQMISKWPVRGGPVIADDIVYFAAGIWPSDGIYLYALDAQSGAIIWQNSECGAIYMPQPHPGADAKSGVSAQGYLVVSGDQLFVPTGRAVPASFDRRTGELEYFHLQKYGHNGESLVMVVGDTFFNGGIGYDISGGLQLSKVGGGELAATADGIVRCFGADVGEYRWEEAEKPNRKGETEKVRSLVPLWSQRLEGESTAVISAGSQLVIGRAGQVEILDTASKDILWKAPVHGNVFGLAVSDQRLLVSTDRGNVHCFTVSGQGSVASPAVTADSPVAAGQQETAPEAEEIVRLTDISRGYCLVMGSLDGALASTLARRSELQVVVIEPDADAVAASRARLRAEGLYGRRVVVLQRDLADTGCPQYFADLIVLDPDARVGIDEKVRAEAERLQRPWGGVLCQRQQGQWQVSSRGPLPGSGSWTHQYADPANSVNSQDALVKGQLSILWYRDLEFAIPSRHGRAPSPLFDQGRLFHEGMDGVVAVDAYNGRELWRYDIPNVLKAYDGDELMGVAGTGSNFCLGDDSVYIRDGARCLRLNAATGTLLGEFFTPKTAEGSHPNWGYIAWSDGMLFGSTADADHVVTFRYVDRGGDMSKQFTESTSLFVTDSKSGEMLWQYQAAHSIRHNAIAVAEGKVFLIDRPIALFDREKKPATKDHPLGKLVALDARSGKVLWQNEQEIYGTMLAVNAAYDVIVMSYQPTRFRLDSELGGRMTAFRTENGERIWEVDAKYESRPTLNDRTIYAQGGAWDLLTGQSIAFDFQRSYGCGILAACRDMLVFRSATLGYYDLSGNRETENYGGIRPGCWINALPAGGLVLLPDATSGCECSYLNKAWIALEPVAPAQEGGSRKIGAQ